MGDHHAALFHRPDLDGYAEVAGSLACPFWTGRAGHAPRTVNLRKEL
jgi:hypothetical protein